MFSLRYWQTSVQLVRNGLSGSPRLFNCKLFAGLQNALRQLSVYIVKPGPARVKVKHIITPCFGGFLQYFKVENTLILNFPHFNQNAIISLSWVIVIHDRDTRQLICSSRH